MITKPNHYLWQSNNCEVDMHVFFFLPQRDILKLYYWILVEINERKDSVKDYTAFDPNFSLIKLSPLTFNKNCSDDSNKESNYLLSVSRSFHLS